MYKVAFFKREDEQIPVKVLCRMEDTEEQVREKADYALMDLLEDEYDMIDWELTEIKVLAD